MLNNMGLQKIFKSIGVKVLNLFLHFIFKKFLKLAENNNFSIIKFSEKFKLSKMILYVCRIRNFK